MLLNVPRLFSRVPLEPQDSVYTFRLYGYSNRACTRRSDICSIATRHGAGNVRIFGSVARGEARPDSNMDLLIDVVGPTTSWFPGGLLNDLESLLGQRVDVVIARLIRDSVLRDASRSEGRPQVPPLFGSKIKLLSKITRFIPPRFRELSYRIPSIMPACRTTSQIPAVYRYWRLINDSLGQRFLNWYRVPGSLTCRRSITMRSRFDRRDPNSPGLFVANRPALLS
jgi:predicted nucleotidyltransferase